MLIRSTGLGRTLLSAKVANIEVSNVIPETLEPSENGSEPKRMLLTMETVEPVDWIVRIFLEPPDVRRMLWLVFLRPSLLFSGFGLLFRKSKKPEPTT
ncbi:MAG: hypothetical protein JRJ65_01095 [Deltaproteobacteria bacterium]|nr:hypothetical protein [Deltaproteobacteria bacterium]